MLLTLCAFLFSCDRVNDVEGDSVSHSKNLNKSTNFLYDNLNIIKKLSEKSKKSGKFSLELKETSSSIPTTNSDYVTLYNNAVDYLINYGGISQEEINNIFKVDGDYRVIITAIALSQLEENVEATAFAFEPKTLSSGIGNCVLEAVGINSLIKGEGAKLLARKVAAKLVPYVGWGLAAAHFADCMGWFD